MTFILTSRKLNIIEDTLTVRSYNLKFFRYIIVIGLRSQTIIALYDEQSSNESNYMIQRVSERIIVTYGMYLNF